jgi:HTH-type transcriptional repressor of NAD biosynthesis genes
MSTGFLLGKFMPPHDGHRLLIDFARRFVDDLTVLVCSLPDDPIAGSLRHRWMRELFPDCRVCHETALLPQTPADHPEFWSLWVSAIRRHLPSGPDFVFASEAYGARLAAELNARFIPLDIEREMIPMSGTTVRADPLQQWDRLPAPVRAHFVRRVCLFGPESTGKSTLARELARRYGTVHAFEFARPLLDAKQGRCDPEDIPIIARGQRALEDALARQARRVLFCDTDALTTAVWSEVLFGSCPHEVLELARAHPPDLYLLLDVDVPWVDDGQRYLGHAREDFLDCCRRALDAQGVAYRVISGNWQARLTAACAAVDDLLASKD